MYKLDIPPLSVNAAYKGRKFKTPDHTKFKTLIKPLLKRLKLEPMTEKQEFFVIYKFYISATMDIDNPIKMFQDALCDILKTDDRYISGLYVRKIKVKRGNQKIEFDYFQNEHDFLQAIQHLGEEIGDV